MPGEDTIFFGITYSFNFLRNAQVNSEPTCPFFLLRQFIPEKIPALHENTI